MSKPGWPQGGPPDAGKPQIYDKAPPQWTGVPIERDPVSGKLLSGDPLGRGDKGRKRPHARQDRADHGRGRGGGRGRRPDGLPRHASRRRPRPRGRGRRRADVGADGDDHLGGADDDHARRRDRSAGHPDRHDVHRDHTAAGFRSGPGVRHGRSGDHAHLDDHRPVRRERRLRGPALPGARRVRGDVLRRAGGRELRGPVPDAGAVGCAGMHGRRHRQHDHLGVQR